MDLTGLTVGIVIAEGYHEHEFWFPYYRFREAGAEVLVDAPCVRDGNLITAVYFGYLPEHFRELMPALREARSAGA